MLPQAATDFYALQQRVNFATKAEVGRLWRGMGDDFDTSWRRIGPAILSVLTEAQERVALAALDYVPRVLAETDIPDQPVGDFRPLSLVGIASDGRSLVSLAYGGVVEAKAATGNGAPVQSALDRGGAWMEMMTALQVADVARQAVGVMTASRKNLGGTVRVLNPPSCQRCAILAGRFYRWSTGFDRHPRCDCVNLPSKNGDWAKAEGFITDPMAAYRDGLIRDLTEAQKFAIDNGADIAEVVNAYRGMSTTATETAKSIRMRRRFETRTPRAAVPEGQPDLLGFLKPRPAQQAPAAIPTPELIYREADTREEAVKSLIEWGYIK